MTEQEFFEQIKKNNCVEGGSEMHQVMHALAQNAIRITHEINNQYHTEEELVALIMENIKTKQIGFEIKLNYKELFEDFLGMVNVL